MEWLKAFHIMAVIAWMAGLFYLPRLYVYHADAKVGSEMSATFKIMEERLLRIIMNPAMMIVWITGITLVAWQGVHNQLWFIVKFALVAAMTYFHIKLSIWRKEFAADANTRENGYYRRANEIPTVLMALIVLMVVLKPF
jgi:protoporphyrinogen IX oxidase